MLVGIAKRASMPCQVTGYGDDPMLKRLSLAVRRS